MLQIINHDGNMLAKTVDYEYDLISGKVNKVYYQKKKSDQLIHVYVYDGDNRITDVKTSTDDVLYTKEATYQYYAHGPLARTTTGELNVETQNYAYTVQGWIKQMQAEAFSYALGYNGKDYTAIGATASILATPIAVKDASSQGLYNGNIASMTSNTPEFAEKAILQQQYSYDQLNRITASNTPGASSTDSYKTSYSYDANGNIQTLARYDGGGVKFDALDYKYETKADGYKRTTNKLRSVDDVSSFTAIKGDDVDDQSVDNYTYDAIGNLISDNQEEIEKIEWTVSGKVRRVIRTASSTKPNLEFEYDASGQRIVKKVIKKDGKINVTYYLRDASGNVMSVYEYNQNDDAPVLAEQYLYGSSRIGVYTPVPTAVALHMGSRSFGRKSYELSDHLGNVRATLSDYRRLASIAKVKTASDYYPFGMQMTDRMVVNLQNSEQYRYGFNGKEHEDDINRTGGDYDFGARIYDSRIGRWLAIDPLRRKYTAYSPYNFALNNPIYLADIDGREVIETITTETIQSGGQQHIIVTHTIDVTVKILDLTNQANGSVLAANVTSELTNAINGSGTHTDHNVSGTVVHRYVAGKINVTAVGSMSEVAPSDHLSVVVDNTLSTKNPDGTERSAGGWGATPGKVNYVELTWDKSGIGCTGPKVDYIESAKTIVHELGHNFGLPHQTVDGKVVTTGDNAMSYSPDGSFYKVDDLIDHFNPSKSNAAQNSSVAPTTTTNYWFHTSTNEEPYKLNTTAGEVIPKPIETPKVSNDQY